MTHGIICEMFELSTSMIRSDISSCSVTRVHTNDRYIGIMCVCLCIITCTRHVVHFLLL